MAGVAAPGDEARRRRDPCLWVKERRTAWGAPGRRPRQACRAQPAPRRATQAAWSIAAGRRSQSAPTPLTSTGQKPRCQTAPGLKAAGVRADCERADCERAVGPTPPRPWPPRRPRPCRRAPFPQRRGLRRARGPPRAHGGSGRSRRGSRPCPYVRRPVCLSPGRRGPAPPGPGEPQAAARAPAFRWSGPIRRPPKGRRRAEPRRSEPWGVPPIGETCASWPPSFGQSGGRSTGRDAPEHAGECRDRSNSG